MHPAVSGIDQKIEQMEVWHLALPVNSRRDHGIGTVANSIEVVIVKLTCEGGVTGFGEASPWSVFTGTPEGNFAALNRYMRPHVVGARVGDFGQIMAVCRKAVVHSTEAKAALEAALLDLAGKILGLPVWHLLGEKFRDGIPLSCSLANPDFEQDIELAHRLRDDGVRIVKLKTGFSDHAFDMMRLETIKTDFPEFDVRVDYNQGLSVDDALRQVPEIDRLEPSFIEQPVAFFEYAAMAQLRTLTTVPLLADESVFNAHDMRRAIDEKICDGVSVKIMKSGGMIPGLAVAQTAAEAGLPAYGGDMFETGLAHLAGTHMIAVSPDICLGCEFYQATYYLQEDLLGEPFPVRDGMVEVPDRPGLGFDVNMDVVNRCTVAHDDGKGV